MDNAIIISNLNDFVFCPVSIYFHNLYGNRATITYQNSSQIVGSAAHKAVDENTYSTSKYILTGISVYSEKYNVVGKIDIYNLKTKTLIERKRKITNIYDGYVFQVYAQYYCLLEMCKCQYKNVQKVENKNVHFIPLSPQIGCQEMPFFP